MSTASGSAPGYSRSRCFTASSKAWRAHFGVSFRFLRGETPFFMAFCSCVFGVVLLRFRMEYSVLDSVLQEAADAKT